MFISRRPGIANFAEIIKVVTMIKKMLKKIFEDSKKVKKKQKLCTKMQSISVFSDIAKFADFQ